MSGFLGIWKSILSNPFSGYSQVTKDTKIAWPLVVVLLLVVASTTLMLPITGSQVYLSAAARIQLDVLSKRGVEMDEAQLKAMQDQLASPATRALTVVAAYVGALITYAVMLLILALLMKALTASVKASVTFKHVFAIIVFASIVTAIQGLIKTGITLAGDWEGALRRAQNTEGLRVALQSSLSLALFIPYESLGKIGFALVDTATDVLNWIYYIFIYAGLRSSAGLGKSQALIVVLITAVLFLAVSVALTLLF